MSHRNAMKRFVVSSEKSLAEVLHKLAVPVRFVREGRVFVGSVRAKAPEHTLTSGDLVRVEEPSATGAATAATLPPILFEDDDIIALDKPAGISTIGDQRSEADSLRGLVAAYRACPTDNVHSTSRLDRLVSGVVTFALTKRARDELTAARERGVYERRYFAIGRLASSTAGAGPSAQIAPVWDAPIGRAKNPRLRMIRGKDATSARTHAALVAQTEHAILLALEPQTGRTHQLRLHAAHADLPLFGDKDYGGPTHHTGADGRVVTFRRIALHAARVRFPYRGTTLVLEAEVPDDLASIWKCLGGLPEAWNTARRCAVP